MTTMYTLRMRAALAALVWLLSVLPGGAQSTSTINPAVPAQNSPLLSAPIRGNFLAAYNDINAIYAILAVQSSILGTPNTWTALQTYNAGILANAITSASITSSSLTAGNPVIGGGGSPLSSGSRSGNTTTFATVSGPIPAGNIAVADGNGNLVNGGSPAGGGGLSIAQQSLAVTALNTLAALSSTPAGAYITLVINGMTYTPTGSSPPFSVSSTTVTWSAANAGFSLLTSDIVIAIYTH